MSYPADPNPLKNERPWITRTPTDCDINVRKGERRRGGGGGNGW